MARERRQNVKIEQPKAGPSAPSKEVQARPDSRFSLGEYLILNLVFWAFCLLQYLVVVWVTGEKLGLQFFFLALAIGFSAVSIFSWCFDAFFPKEDREEQKQLG